MHFVTALYFTCNDFTPDCPMQIPSTFTVFGLNHDTAPLAVREQFHFSENQIRTLYVDCKLPSGSEWLILSTCNRTEFILHGDYEAESLILKAVEKLRGPWPKDLAFRYEGEKAVRHVIAVTAGLKSQIVGDGQILGQVKEAYTLADDAGSVGPLLHRLLHSAFQASKQIITETQLGRVARSTAQSAVHKVCSELEITDRKRGSALVIGAAQMGNLLISELIKNNFEHIAVANRTTDRTQFLSRKYGIKIVDWARHLDELSDYDAVFVATGAPTYVLNAANVESVTADNPTLIFDLSVPRNVNPDVRNQPGVELFDMDALGDCVQEVFNGQDPRIEAQKICNNTASTFEEWVIQHQLIRPIISVLHDTFESIRKQEVEKNSHRFDEHTLKELEKLTLSITQKILAIPIIRLKSVASEQKSLEDYARVLCDMFDRSACER